MTWINVKVCVRVCALEYFWRKENIYAMMCVFVCVCETSCWSNSGQMWPLPFTAVRLILSVSRPIFLSFFGKPFSTSTLSSPFPRVNLTCQVKSFSCGRGGFYSKKTHTRTKTHTHRRLLAHITKRKYAYHGSVMGNERSVSVTQLKTFGIRLWLQTLNVCCVRTCVCRVFTLGVHVVTGLLLRLIQLISSPQRLIICHLTGVGLLCVSTLWSVRVFVYTLCPYLYAYSIYVSGSLVSDWQSSGFSNWGMNGIILKRILNALCGSYIFKQNIKCKYDLC